MKLKWIAPLVAGFVAAQAGAEEPVLKTEKDKASYVIGIQTARNLKKDKIDIDLDLMMKGMKDGLSGAKPLMSDQDIGKFMSAFMLELKRKTRLAAEDNRMKAAAFLDSNKSQPGIVALPSGVQYRVVKAGEGQKPTDADEIVCNYRGTLLDGSEFDKTEAGKPATLKLAQLIPGWREVLKLMPVGSKWQVFIPPQLGYGDHGVGGVIGPNELLTFDVELVSIKPAKAM